MPWEQNPIRQSLRRLVTTAMTLSRNVLCRLIAAALLLVGIQTCTAFRAPATPLVVLHPYFSIWSPSDELAGSFPSNGPNGVIQALTSMIRVDGRPAQRIMGLQGSDTTFPQTSVVAHPRSTVYDFEGLGVHLTLTFSTATFPAENLEWMSRPVTYLTWAVHSVDGQTHKYGQVLVLLFFFQGQ